MLVYIIPYYQLFRGRVLCILRYTIKFYLICSLNITRDVVEILSGVIYNYYVIQITQPRYV